ncbi:hypothetical protein E0H75_20580 [Kribbella capetownensis]|uniref:ANTAR domain-containing protein n=1 Tax=Kribbella capetownensis TaxID=1572659 RepID=A0A4R0JR72_9ACTN|nr:hypothetical protein [Kribbella capetownensis]TCC48957.1 hypothetical protein E0H75_20580 [Kribbella capetownensis]
MGFQPSDGIDRPRTDDPETAALREQATGVLAAYHQIELAEAGMLLIVLAEYLDCSVDALAAEVLRTADEPPQSGDFSPERSGTSE